jgi:hypothetical protein
MYAKVLVSRFVPVPESGLSSLLYISPERNPGSGVMYLDGTIAWGRANARQTDQVGERHGRSLSRYRRYRRKRLGSDGASYRLYVKGRLSGWPLSLVRQREFVCRVPSITASKLRY